MPIDAGRAQEAVLTIAKSAGRPDRNVDVIHDAIEQLAADTAAARITGVRSSSKPLTRTWQILDVLRDADDVPATPVPLMDDEDQLIPDVVFPATEVAIPVGRLAGTVLGIEDLVERLRVSQTVVTAAIRRTDAPPDDVDPEDAAKFERLRWERDMAALRLLAPHEDPKLVAKAWDALQSGDIGDDAFARIEARAKLTDKDRADRNVMKPTQVARLIGVTRGLVNNRIITRAGTDLPTWPFQDAVLRAARAGAIVHRYAVVRLIGEQIRNQAIDEALLTMSNADVARILGLTTARLSQLRAHSR